MQIWTFFFPWLLYHKYILPEFKYHHYTNGDERWKLNPATIMYDISARAPATADFAFGNNPWKTFAPSFNQIPWHEWTRNDNPDIERGWSQFGTNYPGPLHSWKENIDGVHSLRNYQESRGSWASNAFMDLTMWQMFCFGVESLNNDLKYQYWDVWRDPVEDRNEGLGWMRLWRRTRNESGGTGGIYLIDPLQGGHLGREYWSFH